MVQEVRSQNLVKNELLERVTLPFKRITYTEAVDLLKDYCVKWGDDLKSSHEQALVKMFGDRPLFITHYPKEIKFFNMRRNDLNKSIVNSTDLILPLSGEAVGAAEREYEYDSLLERLKNSAMLKQLEAKGGSIEDFRWYLDHMKEHGSVLHAGCGIGLNRITQFVLGKPDIRDCCVYPINTEIIM
jgi:asparaginyl-tRNA synthetase